jgi:DNA-binding NarL/FixJ family response regulator
MFSRGVENLLSQQPGLQIVGREADPGVAIGCIQRLQPDVVILDSKDPASEPSGLVAAILSAAPQARVISLNLENEQMLVYRGERRAAQSVDDLRAAIEGEPGLAANITVQK